MHYSGLNEATTKNTYALPRINKFNDLLGAARQFRTLNANGGCWQILVKEEDQDKTAFVFHTGLHCYKQVPFGLTNAPAIFQRAQYVILSGFKRKPCLVCHDNVIVFSILVEEHFRHDAETLLLLNRAQVPLKLSKCEFFRTTVNYLGQVANPENWW